MSELVDPAAIESIVGAPRADLLHIGRAVSSEQMVFVMHSRKCVESGTDPRDCIYSLACDEGIDLAEWGGHEDMPVILDIEDGRLVPLSLATTERTGR